MKLICYDNGGSTMDRFTVIDLDSKEAKGLYGAIGASADPFAPQGFGQYTTAMRGGHLGRRIAFDKLPKDVQTFSLQNFQF